MVLQTTLTTMVAPLAKRVTGFGRRSGQISEVDTGLEQNDEKHQARWRRTKCKRSVWTAFDWLAYTNRSHSLRLLRRMRVHVDTKLQTSDGFSEIIHWQVITALCPQLLEQSKVKCDQSTDTNTSSSGENDGTTCRPPLYYTVELPPSITGPLARLIVECAYGEPELSLDRSNLQQFYEVATCYDMKHAIDVCLDYARNILDVDNCIYLLQLSIEHKHQKLRRASYSLIRANFTLILHVNRDFHQLESKHLRQLLLDDSLRINEDEEIAWLAIVRWASRRLLSQQELARIYNQMVAEPQGIRKLWPLASFVQMNQVASHAPVPSAAAATAAGARSPIPAQPRPQFVRLVLDFYSPANPIEANQETSRPEVRSKSAPASKRADHYQSPLRDAAESFRKQKQKVSIANQADDDNADAELYHLLKCLRFMRFKSSAAFDAILATPFIEQSARLTLLVEHMRLRYKLRHKIPLKAQEKQLIDSVDLKKLKNSETSRTERLIKSMSKLLTRVMHLPAPVTAPNAPSSTQQRLTSQQQWQQQQQLAERQHARKTLNISSPIDLMAARQNTTQEMQSHQEVQVNDNEEPVHQRITSELLREQFTERSLRRASRPRVPTSVGLLIGGWQDGSVTNSIWAYDFVYDKWFKLNIKLPEPRAFHASCSSPAKGHVYIFGGTNGHDILNSVLRFNPASDVFISRSADKETTRNQVYQFFHSKRMQMNAKKPAASRLVYSFKQLKPMNERRCHLSGVFHSDGRLYALGGHNGSQRLRSAEWYDPNSNQWHPIADMTIARADAAACSHENKIFIAGGQISDQFIQSSVEFYKSSDNTWTFAGPMIIPRMSFSMASYKGHLLAIGGTNGLLGGEEVASVTRSVERYNSSLGAWAFCAPLLQKRCAFGVMKIENKLQVLGGHGGRRRLKSSEMLRIGHFSSEQSSLPPSPLQPVRTAMKWTQRASLPERRSGFSIAVVQKLRNARDFTYFGSLEESRKQFARNQCNNNNDSDKNVQRRAQPRFRPSFIKQPGRWHKFKIMKRRKLVKHLKIAAIVTIVILMM